MTASRTAVDDQLRAWARGLYTTEAATELIIRAFNGRFATTGQPVDQTNRSRALDRLRRHPRPPRRAIRR